MGKPPSETYLYLYVLPLIFKQATKYRFHYTGDRGLVAKRRTEILHISVVMLFIVGNHCAFNLALYIYLNPFSFQYDVMEQNSEEFD